jgi:capsular polysaccharide transport system ATP-binding protein
MVIVAHQTDLIRNHCDHAAVLEDGRLTIYDTVDAAIHAYENL